MQKASLRSSSDRPARDRLLTAATALFCQRGINAVGVDEIVEKAGTAKTTLYKLFGSKEQLVEEVLAVEGQSWRNWFISTVERTGDTPKDRLLTIFPVLAQWFRQRSFYGCPFINAVAEHDKSSDRLRKLALAHKRQVLDFIRKLGLEAGAKDPDRLTHEIALLMDGAIVAAMITRNPAVADFAQHALQRLVETELVPAST